MNVFYHQWLDLKPAIHAPLARIRRAVPVNNIRMWTFHMVFSSATVHMLDNVAIWRKNKGSDGELMPLSVLLASRESLMEMINNVGPAGYCDVLSCSKSAQPFSNSRCVEHSPCRICNVKPSCEVVAVSCHFNIGDTTPVCDKCFETIATSVINMTINASTLHGITNQIAYRAAAGHSAAFRPISKRAARRAWWAAYAHYFATTLSF